jgi:hypothetical protein
MDPDDIVNKRVRRIARDHGCSVDQVHAALDGHPLQTDRDRYLKRVLGMQLMELDELELAFRDKALRGDVASAQLLVKIAQCRAALLGLNAPIGHAVAVVQPEPVDAETSTDKIMAAIDYVCGMKHQDGVPASDQDDPPPTH